MKPNAIWPDATKPVPDLNQAPLLTAKNTAEWLNLSMATFWRRVADGSIPKPIKIGHLSRWIPSEIEALVEAGKADRAP